MDIFSKDIIIPITAAILGIAVPLLISVIQRIVLKTLLYL